MLLLQDLHAALAAEDYGRAAELRDEGCAGLVGWWVSSAEGDPGGHLLRIAPDVGRYSAILYTPRDFAELKACDFSLGRPPFHLIVSLGHRELPNSGACSLSLGPTCAF